MIHLDMHVFINTNKLSPLRHAKARVWDDLTTTSIDLLPISFQQQVGNLPMFSTRNGTAMSFIAEFNIKRNWGSINKDIFYTNSRPNRVSTIPSLRCVHFF